MKRKLALGLTGIMVLSALTGCGKSSSKYLLDVDYSDYVKICEYKGVEAEKVKTGVTKEEIQEEVESRMYDFVTYDPITDRGIKVGDYANIDYKATMDGKEAEDYSSEGEDILVGEGYLYPELEEALIGMKTGENKKVDVELTEDYAEEEDAGKKLSLDVKVNEITLENLPEYNETFVKENTDYNSVADYEASVEKELKEYKEESYKSKAIDNIMTYLIDNSEFDGYPEELYKQCEENYDNSNEYTAAMYGMELEQYLELMGINEDSKKEDIKANVNYELVIGVIAQKEKIDCTEKEIDKFVKDNYSDYEYESEEDFLEDYSKEEIGYELIYEKVTEFLYENAKFKEISEEEYKKAHPEEDYFEDEDTAEDEEDSTSISSEDVTPDSQEDKAEKTQEADTEKEEENLKESDTSKDGNTTEKE